MNTHLQRSVRAETLKLLSLPATHLTALGTLVTSVVLAIAFGAPDHVLTTLPGFFRRFPLSASPPC